MTMSGTVKGKLCSNILLKRKILPKLPGKVHNKPNKPQGYQNIKGGNCVIVGDPPGTDPPPDHNSNIGNKKCEHTEYG